MKKVTKSTYKKDKFYKSVCGAVHELLKKGSVVTPVEMFMEMGNLSKKDYEDWRFGRVHFLESVVQSRLARITRKLRILHYHALDRGLKPSQTVYKKWGKGRKILLRFSKTRNQNVEDAWSRHYVASTKKSQKTEEDL